MAASYSHETCKLQAPRFDLQWVGSFFYFFGGGLALKSIAVNKVSFLPIAIALEVRGTVASRTYSRFTQQGVTGILPTRFTRFQHRGPKKQGGSAGCGAQEVAP